MTVIICSRMLSFIGTLVNGMVDTVWLSSSGHHRVRLTFYMREHVRHQKYLNILVDLVGLGNRPPFQFKVIYRSATTFLAKPWRTVKDKKGQSNVRGARTVR